MCKLGDGNAFCQVSCDKANDIFAISPTWLVATTTIDTCRPTRRQKNLPVGPSPNISLPSCTLPRRLLVSFPVCNLHYFYILLPPCHSASLIPPPTDRTSVVYPLQSLDGTLFCLFIENFQTTDLMLSWKPR